MHPPGLQQRLRAAAQLLQALEHQITRRLVSRRRFQVPGHWLVQHATCVLAIDNCGQALKSVLLGVWAAEEKAVKKRHFRECLTPCLH